MIPTKEELQKALEQRYGAALYRRIAEAAVAVCGLGGLGSHIAMALARAGVGRLILVDYDRVEAGNLHRQLYTAEQVGWLKTEALAEVLKAAAPYLAIEKHALRLTALNLEPLSGAGIICEAFDCPEAKAMLVNQVAERWPEKYLISGSGMAGLGSANSIRTRRITPRFYLCGDGVSEGGSGMGLVSSRVMLCAAHQAHAALRILAGEFDV